MHKNIYIYIFIHIYHAIRSPTLSIRGSGDARAKGSLAIIRAQPPFDGIRSGGGSGIEK
jgi:hypothetical protein